MFMIALMIIIAVLILFIYCCLTLENRIEENEEFDDDIFAKDVDVSDLKFPELPKERNK